MHESPTSSENGSDEGKLNEGEALSAASVIAASQYSVLAARAITARVAGHWTRERDFAVTRFSMITLCMFSRVEIWHLLSFKFEMACMRGFRVERGGRQFIPHVYFLLPGRRWQLASIRAGPHSPPKPPHVVKFPKFEMACEIDLHAADVSGVGCCVEQDGAPDASNFSL